MAPGLVIPGAAMAVRLARSALRKGIQAIRGLPEVGRQNLEPALVRNAPRVPAGRIVGHHKPHSNVYRNASHAGARFYSTSHAVKSGAAASSIGRQVGPFVSTLRPRLCGALPRSAGGYGAGSVRHFSHNPAPQEVIRQVNQAMRAFFLNGKDAYNRRKGGHSSYIKGQIRMQVAASQTGANAPGAYVDFRLAPVLRCFDPKNNCLDTTGLDELQSDFSTVVSDISAVFHDLRRLSTLGDLPITLENGNVLRVHFKGADYELVDSLLNEVGVTRGVVHEDERFSFETLAPSTLSGVEWQDMMSSCSSESESFFFHEEGGFADLSEGTMSIPLESGEEFYDEIDPGGGLGNSSCSTNSSFIFTGHPMDGVMDMGDTEAYRNPWATPARSITASA